MNILLHFLVVLVCFEASEAALKPNRQSVVNSGMMNRRNQQLRTTAARENQVQSLLDNLFLNYTKEVIPAMPLVISMDVLLFKVKSTIEKEGIFESVIGLIIQWQDNRMAWDASDFKNLTLLAFDSEKVWLPDIAMTNAAEHLYTISRDSRFVVRVSHTGLMRFVPTGTARTWCHLKLIGFPFDSQTCTLEFESWSLDSSTMTFDGNSSLILDSSFDSTQFYLCNSRARTYSHTYSFSGETFTRVSIDLSVRRKGTFYVINLIFPCATLSFIQLLTFFLSSVETTVDRIGFGTTNLLTLVVFQTIVTEEMPKTSDAVTALSKYIIALIVISAIGILESVMVERLMSISEVDPPQRILKLLTHIPVLFREKSNLSVFLNKHALDELVMATTPFCQSGSPKQSHNSDVIDENPQKLILQKKSWHGMTRNPSFCSALEIPSQKEHDPNAVMKNGSSTLIPPAGLGVRKRRRNIQGRTMKQRIYSQNTAPEYPNRPKEIARLPLLPCPTHPFTERICKRQGGCTNCHQRRESQVSCGGNFPSFNTKTMWREVAHRIDFLCFLLCAVLIVFIPVGLFLPHLEWQQRCISYAESAKS